MSEDLKVLFPGEVVTVKGEAIEVKPFTFGQLPRAAKLAAGLSRALGASGIIEMGSDGSFTISNDWPSRIVDILSEGGDDLLAFVAFVAKKEVSWFDDMDLTEGIALTKAVFKVNIDFFVQKVVPLIGDVIAGGAPTGDQSSNDSSSADTDGTTSSNTP